MKMSSALVNIEGWALTDELDNTMLYSISAPSVQHVLAREMQSAGCHFRQSCNSNRRIHFRVT